MTPDAPNLAPGGAGVPSAATGAGVSVGLLFALAVQNAVPPFATDMYTPAFPKVTHDLGTTATLIGLTLTTFFIGMGLGQVVGGALSDALGRRRPLLAGAVLCMLGAIMCALAPGVWVLIVGRFVQGFGGGAAVAVGKAVLVDVTHGDVLARTMSILQAIGGLAPMIAPVLGGLIVTRAPWRTIFWALTAFGLLMVISAWFLVPESHPRKARSAAGLGRLVGDLGSVLRLPVFMGHTAVNAFSSFCMFAYIANSSYVLQDQLGLSPLTFSFVFAGNALFGIVLTLLNARLVGRYRPNRLITVGLTGTAASVTIISLAVLVWHTPLVPVCIGFALLMGSQSFVFGNSGALALDAARCNVGSAAAVQGLIQAIANAVSAPLASSGGAVSARPMVAVMIVGAVLAWASHLIVRRVERRGN